MADKQGQATTDKRGYSYDAKTIAGNIVEGAIETRTESLHDAVDVFSTPLTYQNIGKQIGTVAKGVTDTIVLTLADAWLALGLIRPASTQGGGWSDLITVPAWLKKAAVGKKDGETQLPSYVRDNYEALWHLKLDDYYMPLSQTFTLRAKKRLNVSSLVDGIDIIQQTRQEAKTIDCSLRLTLRKNQPNLMVTTDGKLSEAITAASDIHNYIDGNILLNSGGVVNNNVKVVEDFSPLEEFSAMLQKLYDENLVFEVRNKLINETFGVNWVILSEYRFLPKTGMGTFQFDFTLVEVKFGDDVLTLEKKEMR